jgi:hypothetical protein
MGYTVRRVGRVGYAAFATRIVNGKPMLVQATSPRPSPILVRVTKLGASQRLNGPLSTYGTRLGTRWNDFGVGR